MCKEGVLLYLLQSLVNCIEYCSVHVSLFQ